MYIDPIPLVIAFFISGAITLYSFKKLQKQDKELNSKQEKSLKEYFESVQEIIKHQTISQARINSEIINEMEMMKKALRELWNKEGQQ